MIGFKLIEAESSLCQLDYLKHLASLLYVDKREVVMNQTIIIIMKSSKVKIIVTPLQTVNVYIMQNNSQIYCQGIHFRILSVGQPVSWLIKIATKFNLRAFNFCRRPNFSMLHIFIVLCTMPFTMTFSKGLGHYYYMPQACKIL